MGYRCAACRHTKRCDGCRLRLSAARKRLFERKRVLGQCMQCRDDALPGLTLCEICRDTNERSWRKRKGATPSREGCIAVTTSMTKSMKRFELHCVREPVAPYHRTISHSGQAAALATELLGRFDHERLIVLLLDAKNRVFGYTEAARGGLLACAIQPVDVFRIAVHQGAVGIIVAHNHPSCDPTPSQSDIEVTERLRTAGEMLGISLLDHIVVTNDPSHYASLADRCQLGAVAKL
jgi:DNA repair protein RadC